VRQALPRRHRDGESSAAGNTNVTGNITLARVPGNRSAGWNRGLWHARRASSRRAGHRTALNAGTLLATGS
jgi:hypothetical protein